MNDWLNYHHLRYFWAVVVEGGVGPAAKRLHVAQPTVSRQIRELEDALGAPLFKKEGRRLGLTRTGKEVFDRADKIMTLGGEILNVARGERDLAGNSMLRVGVVNALPKLVAFRALKPVTQDLRRLRLDVSESELPALIERCILHQVDVILSDAPPPIDAHSRLRSREVLPSPIGLFGPVELAGVLRRGFPESINNMPVLLPADGSSLRRNFESWINHKHLTPTVAAEFDDVAMLKVFATAGIGVFPAPLAIEKDLKEVYNFELIGTLSGTEERVHVIYLDSDPLPRPVATLAGISSAEPVAHGR